MALTRDKQANRESVTARAVAKGFAFLALAGLPAGPLQALAPPPPCDKSESGMSVSHAQPFGYYGSGFVTEDYGNVLQVNADGIYGTMPAPMPQLERFSGYRVVDCATGEFLAIGSIDNEAAQLLATEFLRSKAQKEQPFTMAHVRQAAQALYKGRNTKILTLRETEQTCSCEVYGGK